MFFISVLIASWSFISAGRPGSKGRKTLIWSIVNGCIIVNYYLTSNQNNYKYINVTTMATKVRQACWRVNGSYRGAGITLFALLGNNYILVSLLC